MIKYYEGDIFTSDADVICHQVNCRGVFEKGLNGQIKKLFPEVEKTYKILTKQWQEQVGGRSAELLGRVSAQPVKKMIDGFLLPIYMDKIIMEKVAPIRIIRLWKRRFRRSAILWT